jgi:hypothetical protein
MEIVVDIS